MSKYGVIYGQNLVHGVGPFPRALVYKELLYHYNRGARLLRCGGSNYRYTPGVNMGKNVALLGQEIGYTDVMFNFGGEANTTIADLSPGGNHYNALIPIFQWAEANGITSVNLDNEMELHTAPGVQRDDIRIAQLEYLLPLGRLHAPSVKIGTCISNNNWQYMKAGIVNSQGDSLDHVGLQLYGGGGSTQNFWAEAQDAYDTWHEKAYLTEYHLHSTYNSIPRTRRWHEWLMAERLIERTLIATQIGYERIYPFCAKWDDLLNQGHIGNDMFAYIKENGYCIEAMNHLIDATAFGTHNPSQWMSTF